MIRWFTLPELSEVSGLPLKIITEAAETGKLITKIFGTKDRRTTDEEFTRWSRSQLYEKKKRKIRELIKDQQEHDEFSSKLSEIHNKHSEVN